MISPNTSTGTSKGNAFTNNNALFVKKYEPVIRCLIARGADLDGMLKFYIGFPGFENAVSEMVRKGAKVNANNGEDAPLHYAVQGLNAKNTTLLLTKWRSGRCAKC